VTFLFDVNVVIALIDPAHVAHDAAYRWFARIGSISWATRPVPENGVPENGVPENGVLRIVGNPRYPNSTGSPAAVAPIVSRLKGLPGHVFWEGDLSLVGSDLVEAAHILTPGQVTERG
jgi:uncharacterized protein